DRCSAPRHYQRCAGRRIPAGVAIVLGECVSRRSWITLILVAIAVGFAIHFGLTFPWTQTLDALSDADWMLLAAAGVFNILSLMAKGGAWHLLLRRLTPVRAITTQVATLLGAAVNSISISVSGEAARAQAVG